MVLECGIHREGFMAEETYRGLKKRGSDTGVGNGDSGWRLEQCGQKHRHVF